MQCDKEISIFNFVDSQDKSDSLKVGEDFNRQFTWALVVDDTTCPPTVTTPQPITGYSFKMEVKKKPSDTTALLTFDTSDSSIVIDDGPNGVFSLKKTNAQTQLLEGKEGTYCYDLRWENGSGERGFLFKGSFQILQTVTST